MNLLKVGNVSIHALNNLLSTCKLPGTELGTKEKNVNQVFFFSLQASNYYIKNQGTH